MRIIIKGQEPDYIRSLGYEIGDVIRNTHGNLMIVTSMDDNSIHFFILSRNRDAIAKMYGYQIHYVNKMMADGKYKLVGKCKVPSIEIEMFEE